MPVSGHTRPSGGVDQARLICVVYLRTSRVRVTRKATGHTARVGGATRSLGHRPPTRQDCGFWRNFAGGICMNSESYNRVARFDVRAAGGLSRFRPARLALTIFIVSGVLASFAWATDAIPPRGVRTVYTANCKPGTWEGNRCYGRLIAGPHYRFEVNEQRGEVHFSTNDDPATKGTYSHCHVIDSANWSCDPTLQATRTIAHQMVGGRMVGDPTVPTLPFHEIEKWRWLLFSIGVPVGHDAM